MGRRQKGDREASVSAPNGDAAFAVGATAVAVQAWRFQSVLRVTVIAKATFAFAQDDVMPRVEPQPLVLDEIHHENNPVRSVRLTTDFVPYLNLADVLFTGHAHALPDATLSHVRLGLFDGSRAVLDKALVVSWPDGVRKLPVTYEHAYGGIGWRDNPYGCGAGASGGAPSVLDPLDERRVAGFAPIGQAWPARKRLLGGLPLRAVAGAVVDLPDDFDWAFFQAAPHDQRAPFLRGDEWIVMDGLHPTTPRVRMRLPGARGLARVHGLAPFGISEGQPLALHADMLRIDGDAQQCTLSFRGTFPVPSEEALAALRVVAGVEMSGEPLAWPDPGTLPAPSRSAVMTSEAPSLGESTISLSEDDFVQDAGFASVRGNVLAGTLPYEGGASAVTMPFVPQAELPPPVLPPRSRTIEIAGLDDVPASLPFVAAPAGAPPPAQPDPRPRRRADVGGTRVQSLDEATIAAHRLVLPFVPEPAAEPPAPPVPATPAPPVLAEITTPVAPAPAPRIVQATSGDVVPWMAAPVPPPPVRPPPPPGQPLPPPSLTKGLYGRFGGKR